MSTAVAAALRAPTFGRRSLVGRLVGLASVWCLLLLAGMGAALSLFFDRAALSRVDQDLNAVVSENLYAATGVEAGGQVSVPAWVDGRAVRAYSGVYWQVADLGTDGRLHSEARSRSLWDQVLNAPGSVIAALRANPGRTVYYNTDGPAQDGHEPLRAAAMLAYLPGHAAPVVFMAAENRAPLNRDVGRFAWTTTAALLLLGAGLVGAVVLQVRVGLTPLFDLRREVSGVRRGRAQRLHAHYPYEIAPLAHELNALLDHNQEVVDRQRTHVGNLAHALKTPISVMLAEAERRPGALADVVERQGEAMRLQVEHHLRRARAAARAQVGAERTEVAEVLDEIVRTLQRIFTDRDVRIEWEAEDGLAFRGERQDLQELAGNLLENACKFCRGRVRATAEAAGPDRLRLLVEDDGPGLDADQAQEMLKRGARLDESAPGSGLGLAIVDDLARAYGGRLGFSRSVWGGLRAELDLPLAEG